MTIDVIDMHKRSMKKTFVATSKNLTEKRRNLIEALRNTILDANSEGHFLLYGISPAVLTDDFVLRASTFMDDIQSKEHDNKSKTITVGYWTKDRGMYKEVWLLAVSTGASSFRPGSIEKLPGTLPLLTISAKYWDSDNPYFDELVDKIILVLKEFFPNVKRKPTCELGPTVPVTSKVGGELQEALLRAQALREKGIYKRHDHADVEIASPVVPVLATDEKKPLPVIPVAKEVATFNRLSPQTVILLKALFFALVLFFIHSMWFGGKLVN